MDRVEKSKEAKNLITTVTRDNRCTEKLHIFIIQKELRLLLGIN